MHTSQHMSTCLLPLLYHLPACQHMSICMLLIRAYLPRAQVRSSSTSTRRLRGSGFGAKVSVPAVDDSAWAAENISGVWHVSYLNESGSVWRAAPDLSCVQECMLADRIAANPAAASLAGVALVGLIPAAVPSDVAAAMARFFGPFVRSEVLHNEHPPVYEHSTLDAAMWHEAGMWRVDVKSHVGMWVGQINWSNILVFSSSQSKTKDGKRNGANSNAPDNRHP